MKAICYVVLGVACSVLTATAYGATTERTQRCVDSFIEQGLENRPVDVRVRTQPEYPIPLILRMEMPLQLTAVEKETGRTIAVGECDPSRGLVELRKQ